MSALQLTIPINSQFHLWIWNQIQFVRHMSWIFDGKLSENRWSDSWLISNIWWTAKHVFVIEHSCNSFIIRRVWSATKNEIFFCENLTRFGWVSEVGPENRNKIFVSPWNSLFATFNKHSHEPFSDSKETQNKFKKLQNIRTCQKLLIAYESFQYEIRSGFSCFRVHGIVVLGKIVCVDVLTMHR